MIAAPLVGYLSDTYDSLALGVNTMVPANLLAAIVWFIGYMYLKPIEKVQKSEEEDEIEERIELMREIISQRDLVKRTSVPSYREEGALDVSHLATTTVAV
jgi:hypothetical protein